MATTRTAVVSIPLHPPVSGNEAAMRRMLEAANIARKVTFLINVMLIGLLSLQLLLNGLDDELPAGLGLVIAETFVEKGIDGEPEVN